MAAATAVAAAGAVAAAVAATDEAIQSLPNRNDFNIGTPNKKTYHGPVCHTGGSCAPVKISNEAISLCFGEASCEIIYFDGSAFREFVVTDQRRPCEQIRR